MHIAVIGAMAFLSLFGLIVLTGLMLGERKCKRENERRSAEWRKACEQARQNGEIPPGPPLEYHAY